MKDNSIQPFAVVRRRGKRLVGWLPADLLVVTGFVIVATGLLTVITTSSLLVRAAVGFPLLFFAPGYAIVSALFPRAPSRQGETALEQLVARPNDVVTELERAALSFGLSLAVLPFLGLSISLSAWTFTRSTVVVVVAWFTLVGLGLATARRLSVPPADRYRSGIGRRLAAGFDSNSAVSVAVNVALVLSVLLATMTVGYALVSPQDGERYTTLQLLTENGDGELVASGFPSELESGESTPVVIGIENQEGEERQYTVVVQEQRFEDGELSERNELQRIEYTVADNETAYDELSVSPEADEGTVRITVLLYEDTVPENPTTETAYRSGYFWTDMTEDGFSADT
ncbi:hypothetical protein C488_01499 [Natrinema pellirubrum DSM 15624]|uniref:Membrane protein n=1 Tax=Natrinema pellirubrum (strain DSM 15624 / CIP 106293 / JCM 10476 / NCIMB 786 / 157) TaxID=797303 RepID=L0JIQ2_NATP1|nr:DUF1616 domain-containing protein [Natrinema pellirubrum]AGB31194.1 putative membrane protein [Natrinema pellirubrum DSM 15624]ELY81442.1 hypothetical protein C488_01499 [Natrinema pellirubrum DSM 15624]